METNALVEAKRRDLLHRFTPTPIGANLQVMGRTLRLETNSYSLFKGTRALFGRYGEVTSQDPEFRWRIVSEPESPVNLPWPEITAFSDEGLRYVSLGHRSFMALDLEGREAVAFLAGDLADDAPGFASVFLATLFDLTAASLGLTMVPAGCVALGGYGLLVFGPPDCGKTTSGYLARRLGLEFLGDQATFLELQGRNLRAWGQFWPAAFRIETQKFLPELEGMTRPLYYGDLSFLALDRARMSPLPGAPVKPVVSVFLERKSADSPRLLRLTPSECARQLEVNQAFQDDAALRPQHAAMAGALARLPAYRLLYGEDPARAAVFFHSLLSAHHLLEG